MNPKSNVGRIIFQALMVFFFIYEVQPIGVPDLFTSRKIVFYIAAFLYFAKNEAIPSRNDRTLLFRQSIFKLLVLGIGMLLWTILLSFINNIGGSPNGSSIMSRTILFIPFVPLVCWFYYDLFDDEEQFMRSILITTFLQIAIVIPDYFSQNVKVFLYNHFVLDTNYSYLSPYRAAGLGAGESLLSIDLFIGAIACLYFINKRKNVGAYVFAYAVIIFSLLLTGSTGTVLGIGAFFIVLFYQFITEKNLKGLYIVFASLIGVVFVYFMFPSFFENIEDFQIFRKIYNVFDVGVSESHIVKSLEKQEVAPLTIETLIGTSIYRGYSAAGTFSRSDTGYLQSYFGYGCIGALVFYCTLYKTMIKCVLNVNDKKLKFILFLFMCAIFLIEAKEPYIHHFGVTFALFMACFLHDKKKVTME